MSAIVINNIEHELPADFTLAQWKQLTPHTTNKKKLIAEAFGVDEKLLQDMDDDAATLGASIVYRTLYPEHIKANTDGLLKFKDMTLGQFIDLEFHMITGAKKTILEIANVLYDEEITDDTPISKIWGAFQSYANYRKLLYSQYEVLFAQDGDIDEVIEDKPVNPLDNARSWYNTVMYVANDDLLAANKVVERPVVEVFNFLAYKKNKIQEEMQRAREKELQRKMKR